MPPKWIAFVSTGLMLAVSLAVLTMTLRGRPGNPTETDLGLPEWKENGPFELSPERGRYALTFSLAENNSYDFSPYLAAFVAPDVAVYQDYFVSLFPPGLSYFVMPGFYLGRMFQLAQVGTFASIAAVAIVNLILIYKLAGLFRVPAPAAVMAAITFLFATPAFTYAVTLYQHHLTTMLLLAGLLILGSPPNWPKMAMLWFLAASAVVIDTPNALFFAPIAVVGLSRMFAIRKVGHTSQINLRPWYLTTLIGALLPLAVLLNFNRASYGNPWQIGGTVSRATEIRLDIDPLTGQPTATSPLLENNGDRKTVGAFFRTRNMLNGLYTLAIAQDRGTLVFTPVLLLSLLGISAAMKINRSMANLILIICVLTVSLYAMWGDPYGGWAFGSRYLIPAYALLTPFLAMAIQRYLKRPLFTILLASTFLYSLTVNTVGALTTSANPPRTELAVIRERNGSASAEGYIPNFELISRGYSKSFLYSVWGRRFLTAAEYATVIGGIVAALFFLQLTWMWLYLGERK